MFLRPEISIIWEITNQKHNPIIIFIAVTTFTTLLTCFSYYGLNEIIVRLFNSLKKKKSNTIKKTSRGQIEKINKKIISFLKSKGKYLTLIPFIFPVIPGIDAAVVISARSLKLNILWFFIINIIKFSLIIYACK